MDTHPKHLPADERRAVTVESVVALAGSQNPSEITTAAIAKHMNLTQGALFRHFPAASGARITHHWGGPLAVPRDWSMSIGYDRATGIGWAGGYSGHGVVSANIGGRTLADLVLGRDTDLVSLPWVGHRSRRWEPEPLRFLASRAIVRVLESADTHEDTTGRRARWTKVLTPVMPPH